MSSDYVLVHVLRRLLGVSDMPSSRGPRSVRLGVFSFLLFLLLTTPYPLHAFMFSVPERGLEHKGWKVHTSQRQALVACTYALLP